MRILITGASGLLGANVALEAASAGHTVFGTASSHPIDSDAFTALTADLLEPGALSALLEQTQPDWVINCAALANLESCERDPEFARRINSEMPAALADLCRKGGARLLHVSTDAVFDGVKGDYVEADEPNPLSVYARTKLAGEHAVADADPAAIVARVNLFGFSPTGRRSLAEFFLNNLLAGNPIKGFTDVYFCPVLVNAIAGLFFDMLAKPLSGLYHVFSADCMNKHEFGVGIAEQFGLDASLIAPVSVSAGGLQAARSPNLTMITHKLSTDLGRSLPTLSDQIAQFYTLYQQGYPQVLKNLINVER
jgi:dTDP-4-dehydrorhamnose reductase